MFARDRRHRDREVGRLVREIGHRRDPTCAPTGHHQHFIAGVPAGHAALFYFWADSGTVIVRPVSPPLGEFGLPQAVPVAVRPAGIHGDGQPSAVGQRSRPINVLERRMPFTAKRCGVVIITNRPTLRCPDVARPARTLLSRGLAVGEGDSNSDFRGFSQSTRAATFTA